MSVFKGFRTLLVEHAFAVIHDAEEIGWAIFEKEGVQLELMFGVDEDVIAAHGKKRFDGFERPVQVPVVTMPGWHCSKFTDGVISLLLAPLEESLGEPRRRIPLHYFDFKLNVASPDTRYGHLIACMYQGLCFARAAQDFTSISGSIVVYSQNKIVRQSSYELLLTPDGEFKATPPEFETGIPLSEWIQGIWQFVSARIGAHPQIIHEVALHRLLEWPDVIRLAKAKNFPMPEDSVSAELVSSQRCTIYKCDGSFYKLVHAPHLDEEFLAEHMRQYKHARDWVQAHETHQFLPEMGVCLLSRHLALMVSKDAGAELTLPLATQQDTARLLDMLLAFCLIPPCETEDHDGRTKDIVHGDIRLANLTAEHCIIDFEFLGFNEPRIESDSIDQQTVNPELFCPEQCLSGAEATTIFTNVWQCGLIVFQMTGTELTPPGSATTCARYIVERAQADDDDVEPESLFLSPEFFSFLVLCRKEMCSMKVLQACRKHTLAVRETLRQMRGDLAKFLAPPLRREVPSLSTA